jgi:hypothetical protein
MPAILRDAGMPSNAHRVDEAFHCDKRSDTARCKERSAVLSFRLVRVPAGVPRRVVSYRETLPL